MLKGKSIIISILIGIASFFCLSAKQVSATVTLASDGWYEVTCGNDLISLLQYADSSTASVFNPNFANRDSSLEGISGRPADLNIRLTSDITIDANNRQMDTNIGNVTVDCNQKKVWSLSSGLGIFFIPTTVNTSRTFTLKNLTMQSSQTTNVAPTGQYPDMAGTLANRTVYVNNIYGYIFSGQASSTSDFQSQVIYEDVNLDFSSVTASVQMQFMAFWTQKLQFKGDNSFISPATSGRMTDQFSEISNLYILDGKTTFTRNCPTGGTAAMFERTNTTSDNNTFVVAINTGATLNINNNSQDEIWSTTGFQLQNLGTLNISNQATTQTWSGSGKREIILGENSVTNWVNQTLPILKAGGADITANNPASVTINKATSVRMGSLGDSPFTVRGDTTDYKLTITNPKEIILFGHQDYPIVATSTTSANTFFGNMKVAITSDQLDAKFMTSSDVGSNIPDNLEALLDAPAASILKAPVAVDDLSTVSFGTDVTNPVMRAFVLSNTKVFGFTDGFALPTFSSKVAIKDLSASGLNYIPAIQDATQFAITDPRGVASPKTLTMAIDSDFNSGISLVLMNNGVEEAISTDAITVLDNSKLGSYEISGTQLEPIYALPQTTTTGFFYRGYMKDFVAGTQTKTVTYTLSDSI